MLAEGSLPRMTASPLSRACRLSDWADAELVALMEAIWPGASGRRHRKDWEFALAVRALERAQVLHEEAIGLSVAAGHEPIVYYLTNRCRWVFATDIYGLGEFASGEGSAPMLADPDLFAPYEYRRGRLVVTHMDALDLRFEAGTFDFVVSFGSIEHFGGRDAAAAALSEMARVLRVGGVAAVTTELVADGGPHHTTAGLELFTPRTLTDLIDREPRVRPLDGTDFEPPSSDDGSPIVDLATEGGRQQVGSVIDPHVRVRYEGREFTSVALALQRVTGT